MLGAVLFITFKDYTYISLFILLILNKHWRTLIPFINFIFIFGHAGSSRLWGLFPSCGEWRYALVCGMRTSPSGGFSCCGAWALERAGCSSCSEQHTGSVIMDQGSNPSFLHWQADSLPLSHRKAFEELFYGRWNNVSPGQFCIWVSKMD